MEWSWRLSSARLKRSLKWKTSKFKKKQTRRDESFSYGVCRSLKQSIYQLEEHYTIDDKHPKMKQNILIWDYIL